MARSRSVAKKVGGVQSICTLYMYSSVLCTVCVVVHVCTYISTYIPWAGFYPPFLEQRDKLAQWPVWMYVSYVHSAALTRLEVEKVSVASCKTPVVATFLDSRL